MEIIEVDDISKGQPQASFGSRFGAFVIDLLIGLPIGFFLLVPLFSANSSERTFGFAMMIPVFAMKFIFQLNNGQSLGQRVARIKVLSGTNLSVSQVFIRNLVALVLMAIPGLNAVNALVIIFSNQKQGIHDYAANTRVVKVD
jgi:uncharacterized RDD family membrane protein YckC